MPRYLIKGRTDAVPAAFIIEIGPRRKFEIKPSRDWKSTLAFIPKRFLHLLWF